ncbi:hypothetical protein [Roseococcus pinisoli]|uniref:Flagellar biosynthesis anti-sigma factor FlgM n=1 Tax=Roseococcus pinisoli TaxID=2835040 RepID=A0ABS5QAA4_9PROT|nr:hypothetical protein [Roseococcus pinisoli]MBS7809523.1 hypothetical protein [Roseococcus pinisoli]
MTSISPSAVFTPDIARIRPGRETAPAQATGRFDPREVEAIAQRKLEAVPPLPARPLPRGSLLDLKA